MSIPGYLPLAEAARRKRIPKVTLWRHIKAGDVDSVIVARRVFVLDNSRFQAFDIDRRRQRAILRGLRASRREKPRS